MYTFSYKRIARACKRRFWQKVYMVYTKKYKFHGMNAMHTVYTSWKPVKGVHRAVNMKKRKHLPLRKARK